jgi:hypothetical protein
VITTKPSHADVSIAEGFALMLETACEHFEILQRLIRQEIRLVAGNGRADPRAAFSAQMALAKSFVFHVMRARRICEHGAGSLTLDRTERKLFLGATADVLGVRNVNEHGFDANGTSRNTRPSMHQHAADGVMLDETSMVLLGDQQIMMGPLNLYNIYRPTNRMRKLAGFASLTEFG